MRATNLRQPTSGDRTGHWTITRAVREKQGKSSTSHSLINYIFRFYLRCPMLVVVVVVVICRILITRRRCLFFFLGFLLPLWDSCSRSGRWLWRRRGKKRKGWGSCFGEKAREESIRSAPVSEEEEVGSSAGWAACWSEGTGSETAAAVAVGGSVGEEEEGEEVGGSSAGWAACWYEGTGPARPASEGSLLKGSWASERADLALLSHEDSPPDAAPRPLLLLLLLLDDRGDQETPAAEVEAVELERGPAEEAT